ncbi:HAD domain-containing protein [Mucilaginibacter sp. AW1-3]
MTILLDIDGVMVTTPAWKKAELLEDGFLKFSNAAVQNLIKIISLTNPHIVLTTTHRISYTIDEWHKIFRFRGIEVKSITKVNNVDSVSGMRERAYEIEEWILNNPDSKNYVIVDDDSSLHRLAADIKARCIITNSSRGLDKEAMTLVLNVLSGN